MKPVSVRIHDSDVPYFYYDGMPTYIPFNQFEGLCTHYIKHHFGDRDKCWIEATLVFDNDDGMYFNLFLNNKNCFCISDMISNMIYSFEHDDHPEEAIKHVKPLFESIKFTTH